MNSNLIAKTVHNLYLQPNSATIYAFKHPATLEYIQYLCYSPLFYFKIFHLLRLYLIKSNGCIHTSIILISHYRKIRQEKIHSLPTYLKVNKDFSSCQCSSVARLLCLTTNITDRNYQPRVATVLVNSPLQKHLLRIRKKSNK